MRFEMHKENVECTYKPHILIWFGGIYKMVITPRHMHARLCYLTTLILPLFRDLTKDVVILTNIN